MLIDKEKPMTLTKNDYIALIIEHIVNQGYKSSDDFVNYITMILPMMNTEELQGELEALEDNAIGLSQ
jgi:hypothetical protein